MPRGNPDNGPSAPTLPQRAAHEPRLRVLRLPTNRGKAAALRAGVLLTDAEYVICIDGDALLEEDALAWMVCALATGDGVGAVTGNPRIRTRSTALGRLQIGEFSTLVGLIKRAQMVMGHTGFAGRRVRSRCSRAACRTSSAGGRVGCG